MKNRETGAEGLSLIKSFEGLVLDAYKCPAGVWTIGYGSTRDVHRGDVITEAEAEKRLKWDLRTAENCVNSIPNIDLLNQNQFDALVSFAFNVGCWNFKKSTLRRRIVNNPIDPDITYQFNRWVYAGGKLLKGLVKRRQAEADLYFKKSCS